MRPLSIAGSVVLLFLVNVPATPAATGAVRPRVSVVEALHFQPSKEGGVITLRTTIPVPAFTCSVVEKGLIRQVVIEFPAVKSRLRKRYPISGTLLRDAVTEKSPGPGVALRIRVGLGDGELIAVELARQGLNLRFRKPPPVTTASRPPVAPATATPPPATQTRRPATSAPSPAAPSVTPAQPIIGAGSGSGGPGSTADDPVPATPVAAGSGTGAGSPAAPGTPDAPGSTQAAPADAGADPPPAPAPRPRASAAARPPAATAPRGGSEEYLVGAGDKLEITILGHDDLARVLDVRGDGTIDFPLLGDVQVAGKGIAQISREMTAALGRDFLVDPEVTVNIKEYGSKWVTVIGEVAKPGRQLLRHRMRLIEVLAEAGGFTAYANRRRVEILRSEDGGELRHKLVVNLKAIESGEEKDAELRAGDVVIVPRRTF